MATKSAQLNSSAIGWRISISNICSLSSEEALGLSIWVLVTDFRPLDDKAEVLVREKAVEAEGGNATVHFADADLLPVFVLHELGMS